MAQSFPASVASFFNLLQISSGKVYLPAALEMSQTGAGEVFTADLGPRLWAGQVTLARRLHTDLAYVEAKLSLMQQAGAGFMAFDPRRTGPAYDPSGAILGAATVVINSLNSNHRDLTLSGLPAGYVITPGDYLGFSYGSSPVRYAMHQVVIGKTANGSGVTTAIEVTPYIRDGAAVGATVTLLRPTFKAVIVPGSVTASEGARVQSSGLSFGFIQTLR